MEYHKREQATRDLASVITDAVDMGGVAVADIVVEMANAMRSEDFEDYYACWEWKVREMRMHAHARQAATAATAEEA